MAPDVLVQLRGLDRVIVLAGVYNRGIVAGAGVLVGILLLLARLGADPGCDCPGAAPFGCAAAAPDFRWACIIYAAGAIARSATCSVADSV